MSCNACVSREMRESWQVCIVVGIRDKALSEKLQMDTLEKAKTLVRQKEAVKEQCQELQE